MKKFKFLFVGLFAFFAVSVQGQIQVGGTVGLQMPLGDFGDAFDPGFGIHAVGKYFFQENMAVGLNLGYSKFGSDFEDFSSSMVPVTALFEYHLNPAGDGKIKPYVGADAGLYSYGVKMKFLGESISESDMYFGIAPTAGVLYEISDVLSLCGNLKYNLVFSEGESISYLGINVGILYSLNK
ncbi:MAG: outer membrane beta-barrel protein [Mariniphaga sp.]|nr:outer membrane beta-barrel protein [Mariniphaga sp.]